jgi:putative toxin-antitoxin system antitoxin component (TIGR02293 family)
MPQSAARTARRPRKTSSGDFPETATPASAAVAEASSHARSWGAVEVLGGAKVLRHRVDTSLDAHDLLKQGLPARALDHMVDRVALLHDPRNFATALGMSPRTRQRKQAGQVQRLNRAQSDRTWKFAEVLARATEVFGSQERAEQWLVRPAIALDRRTPLELLDTAVGVEMVEDLLIRLDYGVYT